MEPTPKLNAFLIADTVIQEKDTNKYTVIGIFENINTSSFPLVYPSLSLYVNCIDAQGHYRFRFELVDLEHNTIIGRAEADADVYDRFHPVEFSVQIRGIKFEHAGQYEFRFWANGQIIAQKSFSVARRPVSPKQAESGGEE